MNQAFFATDNEWLRSIGGELEGFWWRTGDRLDSSRPIRDDDAAIIADIGRGVDLIKQTDEVLEVGTGASTASSCSFPTMPARSMWPPAASIRSTSSPGPRATG